MNLILNLIILINLINQLKAKDKIKLNHELHLLHHNNNYL